MNVGQRLQIVLLEVVAKSQKMAGGEIEFMSLGTVLEDSHQDGQATRGRGIGGYHSFGWQNAPLRFPGGRNEWIRLGAFASIFLKTQLQPIKGSGTLIKRHAQCCPFAPHV
jgi:hypothetical protein